MEDLKLNKLKNKKMKEKPLKTHSFNFTPGNNGGESLVLNTEFYSNGDPGLGGIYTIQQLTLHSYCNSITLNLSTSIFTPEILRDLANQLESTTSKII